MEHDKSQTTSGRKVLRHWHTIFGTFLDKRLKPVNIQVELEVKAAKNLPAMDIHELSDEDHNLAFKLFASKHRIRNQSLENLKRAPLISEEAVYFLNALKVQWQDKGAQLMMISMTEEEILEYGKSLSELILNNVSYEMRLKGIPASERLKDIPASERLKDIPASERLKDIPASELFKNIPADELRALILNDEQLRDLLQPG
jgi:hypothetical protein